MGLWTFVASQFLLPRLANGKLVLFLQVCVFLRQLIFWFLLFSLCETCFVFLTKLFSFVNQLGYFFSGYEAFERMAFYGIASNLVNYLTTQLHEDTVSSIRNVNNWSGSIWLTPIFGAYIVDSFLGRFWTFTFSSVIYIMVNL